MSSHLIVQKEAAIATITFNRPQVMNSLNAEMANELQTIISEFKNDHNTRVLIINGAGNQFMAGGDVGFFYQNLNNMDAAADKIIDEVHAVVQNLRELPQIVIASVHGAVAGVGISFMLAADLVLAAKETKFTLAYSKIGTSPDGGSTYFLPRIVGYQKAMELMLLSEIFDVNEAHARGLVNWVVALEELAPKAQQIAQKISSGPILAYQNIKGLLNTSLHNTLERQLAAEKDAFVAATKTDDFKAGVTGFVNKTKPIFTGK